VKKIFVGNFAQISVLVIERNGRKNRFVANGLRGPHRPTASTGVQIYLCILLGAV
jgi:hypothetical protein